MKMAGDEYTTGSTNTNSLNQTAIIIQAKTTTKLNSKPSANDVKQCYKIITSLPRVIWEEGRVAALSHTYAVKSPLVTMVRHKFAPKSTPSRRSIPNPHPWTRPTYDAKRHPDPISPFPQCTGQTDAPTDRSSTGKFDHYRPLRL